MQFEGLRLKTDYTSDENTNTMMPVSLFEGSSLSFPDKAVDIMSMFVL
jgi:hypothetical protein